MARAKKRAKDLAPKEGGKKVKGGDLARIGGPVPVRIKNIGGVTRAPAQEIRHIRRGGI